MSGPIYIQIFSMTDHTESLNGRYSGPYSGLNAELNTSELREGKLLLSALTKAREGEPDRKRIESARVLLSYRHSDTGALQGTSEMLLAASELPWTEVPGLEIRTATASAVTMKLWMQELKLVTEKLVRVHFMKTLVYLKSFGAAREIVWTDEKLAEGPANLHAGIVEQDLTIAPPGSSGLQVKMGQETTS